jgi:hypothetical protein
VSAIRLQGLFFWVHSGGLVSLKGASIAPKDYAQAHRAMRATTDVVGPCVGLT